MSKSTPSTAVKASQASKKTVAKAPVKASAKTPVKASPKARAKAAVEAPVQVLASALKRPAAAAQPSLRFYHSTALRAKTNVVIAALETGPEHPQQGAAMAALVTELIETGMDYFFLKPLKLAQVGFVAEQSARLGLSGAIKVLSSVTQKFIVRMDRAQLLIVAQHIRDLS
jgi:hypothetical protein